MKRTKTNTGTAKLGLSTETIRRLTRSLSDQELANVTGGRMSPKSQIFPTVDPDSDGCP
jgi:bacteriocin-like protein